MKAVGVALVVALVAMAAPAGAKTPDQAAQAIGCQSDGPMVFDGPRQDGPGVICHGDLGTTYVIRYRNGRRAEAWWRSYLAAADVPGRYCVARRGRVFVFSGGRWYRCDVARQAAQVLGGRVIAHQD